MQRRGKQPYITIEGLLGNGVLFEAEYNEDPRQLRVELRDSLEKAVEDDGQEKTWCVI
jgi:hypothetical protein